MENTHKQQGFMGAMENMNHKMMSIQMTGDPDYDFAAMMVPHHQGAIDMAQIELTSGSDKEIIQMANQIVDEQQKEIANLNKWLGSNSPATSNDSFKKEMQQEMESMMNIKMTMTGNTDKDFLLMMIPHHQSGVNMAKLQVKYGKNAELEKMAKKSIDDQKKEIATMQEWLDKKF